MAPEYLATHVDRLLKALLVCFFDESWPVRDAACVASGRFAGAYPEECRPSLDKLYERFVAFFMQCSVGMVSLILVENCWPRSSPLWLVCKRYFSKTAFKLQTSCRHIYSRTGLMTLLGTRRRGLVACFRWFRHVGDPIWSVRDDSATALGAVCKAYGDEAYEKLVDCVGLLIGRRARLMVFFTRCCRRLLLL